MHHRAPILLITIFVLLVSCQPLHRASAEYKTPAPSPASPDSTLITNIDALASRTLSKPGAVALSIAVAKDHNIILNKGYGKADLEHDVPATEASLFRIASVTKQFTAAAILCLAERGKLSLDDDFTKYVDFPTHGKSITIRHLLTHTSGIANYSDIPGFFDTAALDVTTEKVLDPVRALTLNFAPGTKWEYSNTNYHLLGMIIERVTGVTYARHMHDEFFTPLNLTHTRYDVEPDIIPHRARGYGLINNEPANASHLSMTIPYAAGGLLSSAGDLVQWQLALVDGKVVSPDSYRQMSTPVKLEDGSLAQYGMGLFMSDVDGHANFMHEGAMPGFNSILVYFTREKLTIAVISNSSALSSGQLAAEIAREAFAMRPAPNTTPQSVLRPR